LLKPIENFNDSVNAVKFNQSLKECIKTLVNANVDQMRILKTLLLKLNV